MTFSVRAIRATEVVRINTLIQITSTTAYNYTVTNRARPKLMYITNYYLQTPDLLVLVLDPQLDTVDSTMTHSMSVASAPVLKRWSPYIQEDRVKFTQVHRRNSGQHWF